MDRVSFHDELSALEQDIVRLGAAVQEAIAQAVHSLQERDLALAHRIVAGDRAIDDAEMEIERTCLRLLALQQPVAGDLRAITAGLRVVSDLERMADHAADIARTTLRLGDQPLIKPLVDIPRLAEMTQQLTDRVLKAFAARDADQAEAIALADDPIDHLYNQVF